MKRLCCLLLALALCLSATPLTAALAEEKPVISMFGGVSATQGNWDDMYLYRYIEDKFQIDLDITQIPSGSMAEKINLAFSTGEYPDMFLGGLDNSLLQMYGEQGMIIDLKDYITEEAVPNVYAAFEKYPMLRSALMSYDGHMYRVSGLDTEQSLYPQARFFLNTKWCENLGIAVPATLDEYYDYLVAVRDGDADLDGDAGNEIPVSGSFMKDNYSLLTVFLTAYGCNIGFGQNDNYVTIEDGKVVYVPADARFRATLEYMKKLYDEKLLDNDYFTQTDEQLDAKIATADVGSYMRWANWLDVTDPEIYREWETVLPFTSEMNDTPVMPCNDVSTIGMFALTDKCQHIDKALEILNWSFTEDAYFASVCGWPADNAEGREGGYTVEDLGDIGGVHYFVAHTEYDKNLYANSAQWREALVSPGWGSVPLCRADWMNNYPPTNERFTDSPDGELCRNLLKLDPYMKVGWPNTVPFTDAERNEMSLYSVDLVSYMQQMAARFVTGEESFDNYDVYLQGLKDRGMDAYVKLYQTAYDRYVSF